MMFYIFKIFRRIENFIFPKFVRFFSTMGLGKIPWVRNLSSAIHKSRKYLYDSLYEKLKPKGVVAINILGNKMYVDTDDKDIVPKLLMNGFREERYETILFHNIVKEGMVVVDIGANVGYYSLIAAKLVGRNGIVYAFEPMSNNYEFLCKNIEVNGYTNVVPIKKAVSNRYGKAKLWFEKDWRGSPSLSKDCVLAVSKHKTLEEGGFAEVETISLDEFFENEVKNTKVDVIKVDTGGGEGLVIDGAEEILKSNSLKIFMEFWSPGLEDLGTDPFELLYKLKKYGFEIKLINEGKQALEPIETIKTNEFRPKAIAGVNLLLEK